MTVSPVYRIHPSPAYNGQFVVQKWYPDNLVWGDVGDPCESRRAAEAKLSAIRRGDQ